MNIEEIGKLIQMMRDNQLGEIDIRSEAGERVRLRALHQGETTVHAYPAPQAGGEVVGQPMKLIGGPAAAHAGAAPAPAEEPGEVIPSPIVGIFYASPSPDRPPFVGVGDEVAEDSVVCIIEAMKVMNEIKAEIAGKILKILIENGQPVEYGQPLFLVEPAG
jgi:acetyl-CoA carboxylase biotin carboxyl carrier protein